VADVKLFKCEACGQVLNFENVTCERCGHRLGYLADSSILTAVEPVGSDWRPLSMPGRLVRFCANASHEACNWLVPAGSQGQYCLACRHNRTIPNLGVPDDLKRWRKLEFAKHRLLYTLLRLGLPLTTRSEDPQKGLAFDFLADPPTGSGPPVLTGHQDGLITVSVHEADDDEREKRRTEMGEPYRTLLGHFRHEVGHYFWGRLVQDGADLEAFRTQFGDERRDYGVALLSYYQAGAAVGWRENFISAYATSHPWEDFAESWAHYLHIVDTLETAKAFGLRVRPDVTDHPSLEADINFDPHAAHDVDRLIECWIPLSIAMNSINRAMGQPDLYPFVLSPAVIEKLRFIHRIIRKQNESVGLIRPPLEPSGVKAA
jgi:hypothetical protein